jgi:hypothetical protein
MLDQLNGRPAILETVKAEAEASAYRRAAAYQPASAIHGVRPPALATYTVGDRVRQLAARMDAEARAERDRRLKEPSALIRTMKADWPDQAAAVKAFAEKAGLPLGEAWAQAIAAGVETLGRKRR